VGPGKVFNEAGSWCCNIIKIVELYTFFSTRLGVFPYMIQYIYKHSAKEVSGLGKHTSPKTKRDIDKIVINKRLGGLHPQKIVHSVYYLALGHPRIIINNCNQKTPGGLATKIK
jgi:hypothetical protein